MDKYLLRIVLAAFVGITAMGFLFASFLLSALGLFGVWFLLDLLLGENRSALKGIFSLVILVLGANKLLGTAGSLLQLLHGHFPLPPQLWELPLFLFALVLGEMVRKGGYRRWGIWLIILSFIASIAAAAAYMLESWWKTSADITALLMLIPLIVLSGNYAYRFSLSLVEKVTDSR
jgi:hypothetical protein